MIKERVCFVCGASFTHAGSLGKWQCVEHWGCIRDGRFTCCGKETRFGSLKTFYQDRYICIEDRGCVRADHRELNVASNMYTSYSHANPAAIMSVAKTKALGCLEKTQQKIPNDPHHIVVYRNDHEKIQQMKAQNANKLNE